MAGMCGPPPKRSHSAKPCVGATAGQDCPPSSCLFFPGCRGVSRLPLVNAVWPQGRRGAELKLHQLTGRGQETVALVTDPQNCVWLNGLCRTEALWGPALNPAEQAPCTGLRRANSPPVLLHQNGTHPGNPERLVLVEGDLPAKKLLMGKLGRPQWLCLPQAAAAVRHLALRLRDADCQVLCGEVRQGSHSPPTPRNAISCPQLQEDRKDEKIVLICQWQFLS